MLQKIRPRWSDVCVVAASGPSLNEATARACSGFPVLAVNDAWRLFPSAEVLYACDGSWWDVHGGVPAFNGERWSSQGDRAHNDKRVVAERYGLQLVRGRDEEGFSTDPDVIHYGDNSGFQGVNLALHFMGWRGRVVLVGFDMRMVDGSRHFFGEHPQGLRQTGPGYSIWPQKFARAAALLPAGIEIVNATPGSALTCFPMMKLEEAIDAVTA